MSIRAEAEENLRVIRSLMEKATVYRAISAEAAAIGGVLAVVGSFAFGNWCAWLGHTPSSPPPGPIAFLAVWIGILLIVSIANFIFLKRAAARRGEPLFSSGMKLALSALLPNFAVAGWLTTYVSDPADMAFIPAIWIASYGLALLAARHFAPRSLGWLGWAFLCAGFLAIYVAYWARFFPAPPEVDPLVWKSWNSVRDAQMLMALTFGLFHLIYAACVWPRKSAA